MSNCWASVLLSFSNSYLIPCKSLWKNEYVHTVSLKQHLDLKTAIIFSKTGLFFNIQNIDSGWKILASKIFLFARNSSTSAQLPSLIISLNDSILAVVRTDLTSITSREVPFDIIYLPLQALAEYIANLPSWGKQKLLSNELVEYG